MKSISSSDVHRFASKDIGAILFYWFIAVTTFICNYGHIYEYTLKWKIHDTLGRPESSEDTFMQVYVHDLKEIHHYDHHNMFWDRSRQPQYINSRYLKHSCDSLTDEFQKFYSGIRRNLVS